MLGLPDKNTEIQGMVDLGLHGRRMAKKKRITFCLFRLIVFTLMISWSFTEVSERMKQ